jgi:hypothetical protein
MEMKETNSDTASVNPSSAGSDKETIRKWFLFALTVVAIAIVLLALTVYFATKDKKDEEAASAGGDSGPDVDFSYCQTWSECANTPAEYAREMDHFAGFFGPACVSNNMMGRVVTITNSTNTSFAPNKLRNSGRMSFTIGPEMLARILVIGQYQATKIVQELGYGSSFTCGTPDQNYTNCQYRLIVWAVPCPKSSPPLIQAFWENLHDFWQSRVYGDLTPNITDAVNTIRAAQGLLKNFTGCDPTILNAGGYSTSNQQAAGCSQEFQDAMSYFNIQPNCNGTDAANPQYTPQGGCTAEDRFLALSTPTAAQLRAYLMQKEGFNPLYTGYGFTSNTDYFDPLQQEFWYQNDYITNLPDYNVITFYNGTALGLI